MEGIVSVKLEELSDHYRAQAERQLRHIATPPAMPAPAGDESSLQADCERWLRSHGYEPRTPKAIQRHNGRKWYVHLHEARTNPILCDLLILDARSGRYLEVELKTATGEPTPDQRALILRGEAVLCRSVDEFAAAVEDWRGLNP